LTAQSKLQTPYIPEYRVGFDTLGIIDDIGIPYGKYGAANYFEPITKDYMNLGVGGATQAITNMHRNFKLCAKHLDASYTEISAPVVPCYQTNAGSTV